MDIFVRKYESKDAEQACAIWNQVVEDGVSFPQEETLTIQTGEVFFKSKRIQELLLTKTVEKSWDCIFCIPIM